MLKVVLKLYQSNAKNYVQNDFNVMLFFLNNLQNVIKMMLKMM